VEAAAQPGSAPAVPRKLGSQQASVKMIAPRPSAMAANCTARVTPKAVPVTVPVSSSPSSAPTPMVGAAASPTTNTKPPDTGCASAEITR
jgi:hypothetical protein